MAEAMAAPIGPKKPFPKHRFSLLPLGAPGVVSSGRSQLPRLRTSRTYQVLEAAGVGGVQVIHYLRY